MKTHRTSLLLLLAASAFCLLGSHSTLPAQVVDLEEEWKVQFHNLAYELKAGRPSSRPYDERATVQSSDKHPTGIVLRRTRAMLDDLEKRYGDQLQLDVAACRAQLEELEKQAAELDSVKGEVPSLRFKTVGKNDRDTHDPPNKAGTIDFGEHKDAFIAACELNRKIALANPLFNFDRLVFVKKHPTRVGHMCDQWFGMAQDPGGGLFVLEKPGAPNATVTDLTKGVTVSGGEGIMVGKTLHEGVFASPEVTYDGKTIWFAYSALERAFSDIWEENMQRAEKDEDYRNAPWGGDWWNEHFFRTKEDSFHLMKINADGTDLIQVTAGAEDDHSPCVLPNGRVAFVSTRRGGEGRCHPRPCPSYVLHTMLPDGSNIEPLSYHEINEWTPRVNNDGMLVYSRWDYVDRAFYDGQHPWIAFPDGRDSRDLYGNYENTFRGAVQADLRAIKDSPLYVGVKHSHHSAVYGELIIYDSREPDTEPQPGISFLTPHTTSGDNYASPYPLDDTYYLCVWSPDTPEITLNTWKWHRPPTPYGVYLIDKFGNRVLLYRDPEISCMAPLPLAPREKEPELPHQVAHAFPPGEEKEPAADPELATFAVMDVYNSRMPWPKDRNIAALRIFQVFPKTTPRKGNPGISYNSEVNARGLIGEVPVEKDGSAHFTVPAGVPIYLQAIDEKGLAIQSMRTSFYGMPGETNTCLGCHEPDRQAPPQRQGAAPLALQRPPSTPEKGPHGSWPMNFVHLIQPVLDAKCVECHVNDPVAKKNDAPRFKTPKGAWRDLKPWAWALNDKGHIMTRPKGEEVETSPVRSIPGMVGASASLLYPMLTEGSHKDKVDLTDEELRRIVLWLDGFSVFYGAYEDWRAQEKGEYLMPSLQ